MKPTIEQQAIIDYKIDDILVSAAAGSGKTTVLVERIIDKILKGELSLDRVLIVTFTNDAADNMHDKIQKALKIKLEQYKAEGDAVNASLMSDQLDLLPNSYIQTIDSFCSRVLKEKGYVIAGTKIGELFESGSAVLDGNQLDLLRMAAASSAVGEMYSRVDSEDDPFVRLTLRFGDGRNDYGLINNVVEIYNTLRTIPDYIDTIDRFYEERVKRDRSGEVWFLDPVISYLKSAFGRISKEYIDSLCNMFIDYGVYPGASKDKVKKGELEYRTSEWFDVVWIYISGVQKVFDSDPETLLDAMRNVSAIESLTVRQYSKRDFDKPEIMELRETGIDLFVILDFVSRFSTFKISGMADVIANLAVPANYEIVLKYSLEELLDIQKEGTEVLGALADCLELTDKWYALNKAGMHGIDFADNEYAAYEILKDKDAAGYYRTKFKEIYIDEYQDNTQLQDAIIECFSDHNVFRVGDIKQSIYGFRSADPQMFNRKMKELKKGNADGKLFLLNMNHRSTPEILDFVNFIFSQIMTDEATRIEYDDSQKLNPSDHAGNGDIPDITIVNQSGGRPYDVSEEDEGESAANNEALAYGVLCKVDSYLQREGAEYKDICILTRSVNKAGFIADYLTQYGYPTAFINKKSIFEDNDIHGIINLIIVLGNEYRSEYLTGVLLSQYRFTSFKLEEISEIIAYVKKNRPELSYCELIDKLRYYAESAEGDIADRVVNFLNVFDDLKMTLGQVFISEVVESLYRITGVKANIIERKGDVHKLDILKDWLSASFDQYGSDISGIADDLEEMKIRINSNAVVEISDADKEKITAMSIHKSKGLEYKYVILVLDDKGYRNSAKGAGNVGFDKDLGFYIGGFDYPNIMRFPTLEQIKYSEYLKLENNAEEMRLLYVALTRAEKKLSIVTCHPFDVEEGKNPFLKKAVGYAVGNPDYTFNSDYWLNTNQIMIYQLLAALSRASCARLLRSAAGFEAGKLTVTYDGFSCDLIDYDPDDAKNRVNKHQVKGTAVSANDTEYDENGMPVFAEYKYDELSKVPFKVAVTGIEEGMVKEAAHVDLMVKSPEDFTSVSNGHITASMKGTIAHLIFRFLDIEQLAEDPDRFDDLISSMISDGMFAGYGEEDILSVAEEFREGFIGYALSDVGTSVAAAVDQGLAEFEKPIVFAVPLGDSSDFALVQGIIDLIYKTDEGYVIVDYKTDNLGKASPLEVIEAARMRHAFQLEAYSAACLRSGLEVKHKYVYMIRYRQFVEIN